MAPGPRGPLHRSSVPSDLSSTVCAAATAVGVAWGAPLRAETPPKAPSPIDRLELPAAFRPRLGQIAEAWGAVAGRRRALVYSGRLAFGGTLDLDAAGWVPGATLSATGLGVQGDNLSADTTGDASVVSNVAGVNAVRLFQAWYQQRLFDDALQARAGILAIDDHFMVLDSALLFINSGFGTSQTLALNTPAPIYPLGALGAYLRGRPSETLELRFGAYDNDAGDPTALRYFSDLNLSAEDGGIFLGEARWSGDRWTLAAGAFAVSGRPTREDAPRGVGSAYLMVENTVGQLDASAVTLFAHGAFAGPTGHVVVDAYADAGVTMDGAAWSRPHDRVGLAAAWTRFSPSYVTDRVEATSTGEAVLELTYRASIWSWLYLQPDLQYLRAPKNAPDDDAVALALRVQLEL